MNLTYQNDHDHNLDLIANGKHGDFLNMFKIALTFIASIYTISAHKFLLLLQTLSTPSSPKLSHKHYSFCSTHLCTTHHEIKKTWKE
jgi:hypothetical protein